jgi:hypothetical protein
MPGWLRSEQVAGLRRNRWLASSESAVEGTQVEVRHQGLIGRDPIAIRINNRATFALRRREAAAVLVAADEELPA